MSTIHVLNYGDGTNTVPASAVTRGTAKAWVNFNGTGTIAARDSLNLSSLTDNGTGDYTVNFSSAFGAADYATSPSGQQFLTTGTDGFVSLKGNTIGITTSSSRLAASNSGISTGGLIDFGVVNLLAHGNLA